MERNSAIAVAHPTPAGWLAECPTTHELYIGGDPRDMSFSGHRAVALACTRCDALLHTGPERDPAQPQFHVYLVEEGE